LYSFHSGKAAQAKWKITNPPPFFQDYLYICASVSEANMRNADKREALVRYTHGIQMALKSINNPAEAGKLKEWADNITKEWRGRLDKTDFQSISEKFKDLFGTSGAIPALPEKFLKGKLAQLAEDLVREFKPEDFGLDAAALESSDDPSRAFTLLMEVYTQKPELIQNAMKKITKRLQQKVQSGELKPADLAAEAEEMMKNFTDNPAFMELMEGFRNAFGFEDTDTARSAGRDGENRLSIARKRLRAKLEARKGNAKK
jgi:hypothetical protein